MKREAPIGAAAFLAIAAVLGVSLRSTRGPDDSSKGPASVAGATERRRNKESIKPHTPIAVSAWCSGLNERLTKFLEIDQPNIALPDSCENDTSSVSPDFAKETANLKFVIALLPDPLHTHLPVLFDEFTLAIQEAAQDEKYDFDSSWMPWEDEEHSYQLLLDQDAADDRKEKREDQPGIILFRNSSVAPENAYRQGLIVFVVGEDATHGAHRGQFRNAVAWIRALQPQFATKPKQVAILGPTFSGSFPSLEQLLGEPGVASTLNLKDAPECQPLLIFSGSVSGSQSANEFQSSLPTCPQAPILKHNAEKQAAGASIAQPSNGGAEIRKTPVFFRSFIQSDDLLLERFCSYMRSRQNNIDFAQLAIVSEDETAYGGGLKISHPSAPLSCTDAALKLFYPRDISALRGAYQTKSIFDSSASTQSGDTQRRSLPTDLADPAGEVHDSIRSYGGNQTPLTQEAFLLQIVTALRDSHTRYIILRGSNALDQIFLTNFLRRSYPDARLVIVSSDLMFMRERGATGLSGTMTLSTYPLSPLMRRWTNYEDARASDRVFSSDTSEGTYVALRLLLNTKSLNAGTEPTGSCHVSPVATEIFVPPIECTSAPRADAASPMPDYAPPRWVTQHNCQELGGNRVCKYPGPVTWLSTIGDGKFWPLAALTYPASLGADRAPTGQFPHAARHSSEYPGMPIQMKIFLLVLIFLSASYAVCCWTGSYTGKPAFRAHFASDGDPRHTMLILIGSIYLVFMAIVVGWSCSIFSPFAYERLYPWVALGAVISVCLFSWLAHIANSFCIKRLALDAQRLSLGDSHINASFHARNKFGSWFLFVASLLLACSFVPPLELKLSAANRALTYWRSMHILSGLSPIVPILAMVAGLAVCVWFTLHGLALFGPDRPQLPSLRSLLLPDRQTAIPDVLRMFSQDDAGTMIEDSARPFGFRVAATRFLFFILFLVLAFIIANGIPVRSLGAESYAVIFVLWLDFCCSRMVAEALRLHELWQNLRRLLVHLDRVPLRRTMSALRGFSWGSVWKMSGNVLEVRYKVISRQLECMNHLLITLPQQNGDSPTFEPPPGALESIDALEKLRDAGKGFAKWYSSNYTNPAGGDLQYFKTFQTRAAAVTGVLLSKLLLPVWHVEGKSLILELDGSSEKDPEKPNTAAATPPLPDEDYVRNAEEFVCLTYMAFIQNVLGRLRTVSMTIVTLFIAVTIAVSSYPFDPRQALSAVLMLLFLIVAAFIVKVYAEMHRDATLSHVTNTKPGELGAEFWFKLIGFGLAPVIGLLARVFPNLTDSVFSWLQPGISSLK
jgi:hypothetical protein